MGKKKVTPDLAVPGEVCGVPALVEGHVLLGLQEAGLGAGSLPPEAHRGGKTILT